MLPREDIIPDFSTMTIPEIKAWAKRRSLKLPTLRKAELIAYITATLNRGERKEITAEEIRQRIVPVYFDLRKDWLSELTTNGWCTVPVPSWTEQHTVEFQERFFSYLESCCAKFKRHDTSTWTTANLPPLLHGILKQDFGHTELQWQIREMCIPIFEKIWNTTDLLCSFDGGCFLVPNNGNYRGKQWIHTDQPRSMDGMQCFQGVVNMVNNGPNDGGLVLVEGSHRVWRRYMDRHPEDGLVWGPVDMSDELVSSLPIVKVCAPAGHLLLWDSRVFHCNIAGTEGYRMCVYVSMQPRERATEKELQRRIKMYEAGKMSGHWCYGPWFKTNPPVRTYGKEVNRPLLIEIAEMNDVRRRLVGW